MAGSSYDGDAASVRALNKARAQSSKIVIDTILVGDGESGEFDDDTMVALTGSTASLGERNVPGKRRTVAGSSGSKTIHPKAGGQTITKNKPASSKPSSSSASVQDFQTARDLAKDGGPHKPLPYRQGMGPR